jgi:hypothetical protein
VKTAEEWRKTWSSYGLGFWFVSDLVNAICSERDAIIDHLTNENKKLHKMVEDSFYEGCEQYCDIEMPEVERRWLRSETHARLNGGIPGYTAQPGCFPTRDDQ